MGRLMDSGYGKCAKCYKTMALATPTTVVYRGVPKRAYMVHKACSDDPGPKEHPLVVSDPAEFAAASYKTTEAKPKEQLPSMPTREQTGRRKKETTDESTD